jgi:hypothetical protein
MEISGALYANKTASGLIKNGTGKVYGAIVNSHTSGTLRFNDGLTGTTAGVKATFKLTITGAIANNETVTVGGQTYTWKTALTAGTTANEVLLGISDATALDNLLSAINKSAGGGTTYGSDTVANVYFTATTNSDTEQTIEAKAIGYSYNALIPTDTMGNGSWAAVIIGYDVAPLLMNTFTLAAGSSVLSFPEPINFVNGLYYTLGGSAGDVTIIYN